MPFPRYARAAVCLAAALGGCSALGHLKPVPLAPDGAPPPASPLGAFKEQGPIASAEAWRTERAPALREAFAQELYGGMPSDYEVEAGAPELIEAGAYDGLARIERVPLTLRFRNSGGETSELTISLVIAKPNAATGPVPVILKMEFCWFDQVYQVKGIGKTGWDCRPGSIGVNAIFYWSLGKYHIKPPIQEALEQGYAFASIHAAEFNASNSQLAAWAFQYSRAIDYLETDPALDPTRMAVYGHSRAGKAALIAGAFDERIDAVIAHQSGRAGAALNVSEIGEPLSEMAKVYPNWLSEVATAQAVAGELDLSIDQHHLLALLAPRPVLLGHGRRDSWSDPQGAFRAAQGADPVYELLGSQGLTVERLDAFAPEADLSYWIRKGTHGETEEDWPAFFAFLGAHFKPQGATLAAK